MARYSSPIVSTVFNATNTETHKQSTEKIKIVFKAHYVTYSKRLKELYIELS